jgi:DNA-binding transcriptional LysR family regulator
VEIRHLRYFVASAEFGGFAQAAARLHVAQPALSRQIRDLETELNVTLFQRTKRGARLTDAGECFLADVQRLLADLQQAQLRAARMQSGNLGAISVGLVESFAWHDVIINSIHSFRELYPQVLLSVPMMSSPEQLADIRDGRLSAGFLFDRPRDDKALDGTKILCDRVRLAVHKNSPFAQHPPQRLAELANENFFWFTRKINPSFYDIVMRACQKSGLSPRIVEGGSTDSTNLSFVAAGLGCTFVPSEAKWRKPKNVVIVPVGDLEVARDMELVWRKDNQQPVLRNFIDLVCSQYARRSKSRPRDAGSQAG